jgi:hypothetical protein
VAISVTAITPSVGPTIGKVSIANLAGGGFVATPTVKLTKAGQSDINATDVVQISTSKLTCDFNLSSAVLGLWSVVVTNPDTSNATLADGFNICVAGCSGYQDGTASSLNANKLAKKERTIVLLARSSASSIRPASGQIYPRGK